MYCPDCGLDNRTSAKFCANCGLKLVDLPEYRPAPKKASSSKKPSKPRHAPVKKAVRKKAVKKAAPPSPPPSPPVQAPSSATTLATGITPSGTLSVGTLLDRRYKIVQHVATGGMGAVYRGEDTRLNTTVAVKEMLDFFQDHEDRKYAVQRFREEALLLADLRHVNIPRVTDNFIENNRYYLIMDFVEGKSTEKLIRENHGQGLPIDRVVYWAIQIADVLYYLHNNRPPIIYRDMKPSNVMIRDDNSVMLVDFGIARHFTPRRPGTMIGTHGYAPPEQYKGNAEPRSDIFALAATLHHLISGIDPTQGVPFKFQPLRQVRSDVSSELERIIQKALQNRVELRYTNALEMKKDLEALNYPPPSASSTPAPSSKRAPVQRKPPSPPKRSYHSRKSPPPPPSYSAGGRQKSSIDAQNHFVRAKNHADRGKFNRAKKELEKALKLSPDYPEAHSLMGYVLTRMGKAKDAVEHLNRAVTMSPGSATAHLYLGKAYARMGNIAESQKEYRIASRLDPKMFREHNQTFLEKLIRSFLS